MAVTVLFHLPSFSSIYLLGAFSCYWNDMQFSGVVQERKNHTQPIYKSPWVGTLMILGLSQPITRPRRDMSNQFQLWTIPLDNPYDKQKDSCDELWVGPMNWFVSTYNGKPMALNFGEISLNEQKTVDPSLPRKLKSVTCWWNQRDKSLWLCANQITYTSTHQCFCKRGCLQAVRQPPTAISLLSVEQEGKMSQWYQIQDPEY